MMDILCVTNRQLCSGDFIERIRKIAAGRPCGIILREKDLTEAEYKELAAKVLSVCSEHDTLCILHSFYKTAAELKAKAIHLPLHILRKMTAGQKEMFQIIGASCHSVEDAVEAESLGCTYITAGHIFDTDCKRGLPGRGLDFLQEVCSAVSIPVYAIGGIDAGNAEQVQNAGAEGICVMSSLMQCEKPGEYLQTLLSLDRPWKKGYAIFDMDGTLIDSMPYWRRLGLEYLHTKGIKEKTEEILEEIESLTVTESSVLFTERFSLKEDADTVASEMNHIMEEHYRRDIPLKAGVREMLDELRRSGVKMCVASATAETLMVSCLERLGILNYFEFILSCETLKTHKREPLIYLEAAKRLGAAPEETAVYEDALYAVETAKKAGFYVIAVYDPEAEKSWKEICSLAHEAVILN